MDNILAEQQSNSTLLESRWSKVLDHPDAPKFKDSERRRITAQLLENQWNAGQAQQEALTEDTSPTNKTGQIGKYDPILISLVRRAMPNLIAYDVAGVQPMTGPTGLIFALRPKYVTKGTQNLGDEAFYNEEDTSHSGTGEHKGTNPAVLNEDIPGEYKVGSGMTTDALEKLGSSDGSAFNEMGFEIERIAVEAKGRALKAQYSVELAQDLKAVHGLDAETELTNILSTQILGEMNRELIRNIYITAKKGATSNVNKAGFFDLDVDSNGRWSVERFKGLLYQIERDANAIAKETRRGKGNFIICSSDVASALAMAGVLDFAPALKTELQVDDTGNTFAGVLNGKYKVFIDPWATGDYYVVGYRGSSSYDAGIYFAPYVPLQLYKTVSDETFQPKIGFKTRYGLCSAPFAHGLEKGNGALVANKNTYFRRVGIKNIM